MRIVPACVVALAAILVLAPGAAEARKARVKARVLARVPLDQRAADLVFSADGKRHAYTTPGPDDAGWLVVVDGVTSGPFADARDLGFAGGRAFFRADTGQGWRVFVDGVAGEPYRTIDDLQVSADGAHVTYTASGPDGRVVVHDGVAGPAFDRVQDLHAAGARWVYVGERGSQQLAVVDGAVSEPFYYVRDLALSADGTRSAYLASADGKQHVVADGRRWTFAADAHGGDVVWTGDGNVLAWWERRAGQLVAVIEGAPTPVTDGSIKRVAVSPARGKRAAVALLAEDVRRQQYAVVYDRAGSRAFPRYSTADSPTWSADGKRFAYRGWDRDGAHWIVDGVVGPAHADVIGASWSPDGKHVAYQAQAADRSWRMIVDGVAGPATDLDDRGLGPPVWSPDSRHLAYFVLDGDAAVILDGKRAVPITDRVELRWIARGKKLAFGDRRRDGAIVWYEVTP